MSLQIPKYYYDAGLKDYHLFIVLILALTILACQDQSSQEKFARIDSSHSGIDFNNVLVETDELNYFTYPYLYMGGGVAVGDIDNDGLDDVFFSGNMVSNKLYLNKGNFQFEDISERAGIQGDERWYAGATMVDINGDGYLDLYLSVSGKDRTTSNELYINNGDLTFTEEAKDYGIDDVGKSVQSTFFDYDKDGDLDLYVANYPITSFATPNEVYRKLMDNVTIKDSDHLYRNDGITGFTDVTEEAGLLSYGLSLSATVGDLNGDGWEDIYVSNDFSTPDYMYINNKDGSFDEALKKSTKQTSFYGMGVDISDYNNDGMLDIMQVDMAAEDNRRAKSNMASMNPNLFWSTVDFGMHYQYMYNALQLNRGNYDDLPVYSNVTWAAGVATTDWSWGPLFADFDNDGWKDIFVSNGTRRDINNRDFFIGLEKNLNKVSNQELKLEVENIPSEPITNYIFRNNKDLTFSKSNDAWGISDMIGFSNGVAYADLNNDGRLDLLVNNIDQPAYIYKNNLASTANFISIDLTQDDANRNAIGAQVQLITSTGSQHQHLTLTRGFQSSVSPTIHFGLDEVTIIDTLIVTWPDGTQEYQVNVQANQNLNLRKGALNAYYAEQPTKHRTFRKIHHETNLPEHVENTFDDYKFQILLPHKMSQWGPALAAADINGDGKEDLYIGSASRGTSGIYIQIDNGQFKLLQDFPDANLMEEIDAQFFDVDNDGDLDLFVVSGGYELPYKSGFYNDRLYINDNGVFSYYDKLPEVLSSGSCVRSHDYDGDGDLDIFIGGRMLPAQYPYAGKSYLLENKLESGVLRFEDATSRVMEEVSDIGMVTDAIWLDYEEDGDIDLVMVGEWMPITVFINDKGRFQDKTAELGMDDTRGWWFSINKEDLDRDGDQDLVVGNLGINYKYQANPDATFDLYVDDFDKNASPDIVLGYYNNEKQYPVRGRQCSSDQIPGIKSKFKDYESFAKATMSDVYGAAQLSSADHYKVKDFSTIVMNNGGAGQYTKQVLPVESQLSSTNDILIRDFNRDNHLDILLAGNLYMSEVETPRADAGIGQLLLGDGSLNFKAMSYNESGLLLNNDVRKMVTASGVDREYLIAASNQGPVIVHEYDTGE